MEARMYHQIQWQAAGTSLKGCNSYELALNWLDVSIKATTNRMKRGEKRIMIFDGHGSHLTLEILQRCEDHDIIPVVFLPHLTYLCQPLHGKQFLSYKQIFKPQITTYLLVFSIFLGG
jgi:hypothetical protein